jgi:hypothetical protein
MAIVKLKSVRLAFPDIRVAVPVGSGDKKYYSAAFPIEPGSENAKNLDAAVNEAAKNKWHDKWENVLAVIKEKGDIGYKEKPLKNGDGDVYDGFQGMYSVNASRAEDLGPPRIVGRYNEELPANTGKPYGGCYVYATVEVWAQDNANGRRINVQLRGIQFEKDGPAFGASSPVGEDEFDALPEEDGDLFE